VRRHVAGHALRGSLPAIACAHSSPGGACLPPRRASLTRPPPCRGVQVEDNVAVEGGIIVGGNGNVIADNRADYMFLGGPADGSTGNKPLTNDVIVGNRHVENGPPSPNGSPSGIWVTDDTSSKFVDNEFQDDLWAWGSARNDVEENTLRGFVIDGDATAGYVVGNTIRDNVAHGKTKVQAGAAGAAAGGAPRHAREARGRLWLRSGVRAVMHALGAPHAGVF
jgi:hypothetical protein